MDALARIIEKLRWIAAVSRLAASRTDKLSLVAYGALFLFTDHTKTSHSLRVQLTFGGDVFPFTFEDMGDYGTLYEIFVEQVYDFDLPEEPRVILDLGSNIGASVIYFALRFPDAQIYACEPDPENFRQLRENVALYPRVTCLQVAAWSRDETISFFIDPHRGNSSSPMRRRSRQRKVSVEGRTLASIKQGAGIDNIDLLKFDIEGAEYEIFRRGKLPQGVGTVMGELHHDLRPDDVEGNVPYALKSFDIIERPISPTRSMLIAT